MILRQQGLVASGTCHTVLIADYHARMSHGLCGLEDGRRSAYYAKYLHQCCRLPATYVLGSSYQIQPAYVEALYLSSRALLLSKVKDALPQAARRGRDDPLTLSACLYGLMQCLDCCYLEADIVLAEQGQKKIYDLLGWLVPPEKEAGALSKPNSELARSPSQVIYVPGSQDILGHPIAQSSAVTRISIHESKESLRWKVRKMYAPPGSQCADDGRPNALLEFFRHSVFPWSPGEVVITDQNHRDRTYGNYDTFERDYCQGLLHPAACKPVLEHQLWRRLEAIQATMTSDSCAWVDLDRARGTGA